MQCGGDILGSCDTKLKNKLEHELTEDFKQFDFETVTNQQLLAMLLQVL